MTNQTTKLRPGETLCEVCSEPNNHGTGCWDGLCPYAFGKSRVLERLRRSARRVADEADGRRAAGHHDLADELYEKADRIRLAAERHPDNPTRCASR